MLRQCRRCIFFFCCKFIFALFWRESENVITKYILSYISCMSWVLKVSKFTGICHFIELFLQKILECASHFQQKMPKNGSFLNQSQIFRNLKKKNWELPSYKLMSNPHLGSLHLYRILDQGNFWKTFIQIITDYKLFIAYTSDPRNLILLKVNFLHSLQLPTPHHHHPWAGIWKKQGLADFSSNRAFDFI